MDNIKPNDSTSSSLFIDNYIDENYGNIKIYKVKKRLELRLRPKYWTTHNFTLNFDLKSESEQIDVRKLIEKNRISEYQD